MKLINYFLWCFGLLVSVPVMAQQMAINNFIVKENLLKNNKLAIIATDADEKPLENINGTFQFSLNGFEQELKFNDGIAVAPQVIDKSTFVYIRHHNDTGTHAKLYYVIKKDNDLNPIKISWLLLIAIPLILIVIAMMFRRFIVIAAILIIVMLFFNQSNGLHFSTFIETVFDGLKSLV
ncbi:hypothetical protein FW774_05715 [Pedobacter sp. BS3]|uniref:hypothetical protein n=1 Tax=Pedobacter sp. BS3 TaxID=2567937 RepID=UPI0011EC11E1|nr:hypothetical protein [Pedobacter sp. BS3]TZF84488.1 hypothetical protein FW774_05715 [Pedobacter sp. BS3]